MKRRPPITVPVNVLGQLKKGINEEVLRDLDWGHPTPGWAGRKQSNNEQGARRDGDHGLWQR
eukprot:363763-Rhodomonas_salina.1